MMKDYIQDDVNGFLLDTHSNLGDTVDFVVDRFGLDVTDELVDVIEEIREEFFGY